MPKVKEEMPGYYEFFCPGCKIEHPINTNPEFGCVWQFNKDLDKPTALPSLLWNVGGANPSIPICHSFIREGRIQFLSDCTHDLAGQTVEIPELKD